MESVRAKGDGPPAENTSRNTHNVVAELLLAREGGRVLDAPCGEGALALRLGQTGREVCCVDCVEDILQVEGVEFRLGDLQGRLPFDDAFFDAAACVDGIEHVENPFHLAREFGRVLRPGGLLVLSTPNVSALRSRFRFLLTGGHNKFKRPLDEARPNPLHHITPLTFPRLRYVLHTSGFRVAAVRANRVKAASWPYALLYPFARLATALTFRREADCDQRERNRAILRTLYSIPVAFGETLIVAAEKREETT
jgi:SAM-dependent methyltransferase